MLNRERPTRWKKKRMPSQPSISFSSDDHVLPTTPSRPHFVPHPRRPHHARISHSATPHMRAASVAVGEPRLCGRRGRFDRERRRKTPIGSQATARKVTPPPPRARTRSHRPPSSAAIQAARRCLWTQSVRRGRAVRGRRQMEMLGRAATSSCGRGDAARARPAATQTARILR
jgi:hypothetical protein